MKIENPYYRLLIKGILKMACEDAGKKRPSLMFTEFKHRFLRGGNVPSVETTALWVAEFIEKNDIAGYCRSVLKRDLRFERRGKWMIVPSKTEMSI